MLAYPTSSRTRGAFWYFPSDSWQLPSTCTTPCPPETRRMPAPQHLRWLQFYKARCHPTSLLPRPQDAPRRPLGLPTISRLIPTPPGTFQICVRSSHMPAPHLLMSKKAMQRVHGLWRLPGAILLMRWLPASVILPSILQSLAGATVLMCLLPVSTKTSCCTSRHGSPGLCLPTTHHNCLQRSIRRVRFCDPCFRSHGLKSALFSDS